MTDNDVKIDAIDKLQLQFEVGAEVNGFVSCLVALYRGELTVLSVRFPT
jgi:hypothetical protein